MHINKNSKLTWPPCMEHRDHESLDHFFCDAFLHERYEQKAEEGDNLAQRELENLKKRCMLVKDAHNKADFNSIFHCSTEPVNNWDKNNWTKRLVIAIQTYISSSVFYTADIGTRFKSLIEILLPNEDDTRLEFFVHMQ